MAQPQIHNAYNISKGGLGTVNAMINAQPMLINHAITSMKKRNRLDL